MKRSATLLAGAIVSLVAGMGIATGSNGAFAQSHATPNLQIGKPPTFGGGGARARAYDLQTGTMWNQNGWIYRPQSGTYFDPRTGVTCIGRSTACF
jgi:hypothetical protein